jgi:hypothetical protein
MAAPAYTPVATNPFTGGFPSSNEASAAASSAASFGLGYLQKLRDERFSSLRPAGEFFDKNRFSMPSGFASTSLFTAKEEMSRAGGIAETCLQDKNNTLKD